MYQHVEKWVEGDRNKRMKLDKQPWNAEKVMKRAVVYLIWLIFSFVTAITFVSYVVGTDYLVSAPFAWSNLTWVCF